jgi:hypothetical protein
MKDIALVILSLAIAGALRPDEPTPASIATPTTEAVHPATDDDGSGGLSYVKETLPSEPLVKDSSDFPPDAGAEPDADSIAARAVESVEDYATEPEPPAPAPVAAYTDRPTFTRYASCAGGNCAVNAAPIRRRLFGRFR